jgi:hypothetical protein
MIFNKSGRKLKGYAFIYAQQSIGQASEYKYLGIIFKPSPRSGSFLQMYMQPISYKKKKRHAKQCSAYTNLYCLII